LWHLAKQKLSISSVVYQSKMRNVKPNELRLEIPNNEVVVEVGS